MVKTRSNKQKMGLLFKESGSNPSDSISECLIDVSVSLPQELITEILVRLPVKSLLRFKCVCKPWLSLISEPQFIRSHFSQSSSKDENLELLFTTRSTIIKKCCLYSALHEAQPSRHVSDIEFPVPNIRPIVGIINGMVCLNLKGYGISGINVTDLCIWNPALYKMKFFSFNPQSPSGSPFIYHIFSFGYEEQNDDYKVVCLHNVKDGNNGFDPELRIYSLKADSWGRIYRFKGFYLPYPGVFANGKIYWKDASPIQKIVSLDMTSEKFVELQPPEYDAGDFCLQMEVSAGQLLVLCDYCKGMKVDLWVLDKREVEESWCKLVSFPYADVNLETFDINYHILCILGNGEIVFGNKGCLLVYNWKKKEYRNIKVVVDITTPVRAAAYVESLVWPNYA